MISNFSEFKKLLEASLQDNPAIPGEGNTLGSYLSDTEREALEKVAEMGTNWQRHMGPFMSIVGNMQRLQQGHEDGLCKLTEKAIRKFYGPVIDSVELDIQFPKDQEMKTQMEDVPKCCAPQLKKLEDEKIISEIQKRKILNNVTQGEAKNSKRLLNMPEVVSGVIQLMGEEKGEKYLEALNKITDFADYFDWAIPFEIQKEMWDSRGGFAGTCEVQFDSKDKDSEKEAEKVLKNLEGSDEIPEEAEDLFDDIQPRIIVRGVDLIMLIHESVKGIYEMLATAAIGDDTEEQQQIMMNTESIADELEDLRYGPKIAADLRDFINSFKEVDSIENLREFVFAKMVLLPAKRFIDLMCMILQDDAKARLIVQKLINEVKEDEKEYAKAIRDYEEGTIDDEDEESPYVEPEKLDTEKAPNYAYIGQAELNYYLNKAIDAKDWAEADKISKFLKECRKNKFRKSDML